LLTCWRYNLAGAGGVGTIFIFAINVVISKAIDVWDTITKFFFAFFCLITPFHLAATVFILWAKITSAKDIVCVETILDASTIFTRTNTGFITCWPYNLAGAGGVGTIFIFASNVVISKAIDVWDTITKFFFAFFCLLTPFHLAATVFILWAKIASAEDIVCVETILDASTIFIRTNTGFITCWRYNLAGAGGVGTIFIVASNVVTSKAIDVWDTITKFFFAFFCLITLFNLAATFFIVRAKVPTAEH